MPDKSLTSRCLPLAAAVLLASLALVHAQTSIDYNDVPPPSQNSDSPDPQPRVYGDFAKITLTQPQRDAIHKIQREAKDQIAKIEDEAEARSKLLLTSDQLKQLTDIDNERKIKAKKAYEAKKLKERADSEELARRRKLEKDAAPASSR
jgi:Spy/CpxP family protein refolding chaperone